MEPEYTASTRVPGGMRRHERERGVLLRHCKREGAVNRLVNFADQLRSRILDNNQAIRSGTPQIGVPLHQVECGV